VRAVEIRSRDRAEPFVTEDGSTIRELLGLTTAPVRSQSLAEATLAPGQATERHYHAESEEFYYVLDGAAEMEIDGECSSVGVGDAIVIPAGARHQITAGDAELRFLCCCSPPYRHEDTYFD
jgi:mannose-6-phosphate isomerase-like protein (cupin superfamily)